MATTMAAPGRPVHDLSTFPEALKGKRILLCTESFGPVNGVSRTTLMLVNHLRSHGATVAVVAPLNHTNHNTFVPTKADGSKTKGSRITASGTMEDGNMEVRIHGYALPYNPELSIVYPVRLSTIYAKTFGCAPDAIYLASPASLGFQVLLQVRQQPPENQVPVIANFQTDLSGYCAILLPPPLSHMAVYVFAAVQSFLFRHASVKTVFYPSRFVRRYLARNGVQASKLSLLQRGVNTELFSPERRSAALRAELAPDGEILFVCVARLAGEKGFDFLARAAQELDDRGVHFKLVIVGGNRNADVEEEIKALFAPLVAAGRVVFAGFRVGETLSAYYASGDVFLHCSVTETFGLVVLESMASGVPVVARDEGGPSDVVVDGETGYLVPPDDLDTFVDKAVALARDTALRTRMSEASRRLACGASWEQIGNTVAWRMTDVIDERQREFPEAAAAAAAAASSGAVSHDGRSKLGIVKAPPPLLGWLFLSDVLRQRIVDARLAGGLALILWFQVLVGVFVLFIRASLWIKSRVRVMESPAA